MLYDLARIRDDFPILEREVHPGVKLVYLDSTATSQKPESVIAAMDDFYRRTNANIHRGVHVLAEEATAQYEQARAVVARFINASSPSQLIFTRNATEAINLVAHTWARANIKAGELIVLTEMEHHSNLVPWQMLASERNVRLEFIPVTDDGLLDLDAYRACGQSPRLVHSLIWPTCWERHPAEVIRSARQERSPVDV
jgi:cysteine desulfurase/selenocysteine lyase